MNQDTHRDEAPELRRMALAPGLLGAISSIVSILVIGGELFFVARMVIAVLALIIGWFGAQSRQWWWLPLPLAIAVVWNPVVPFTLEDAVWLPLQYVAAAGFVIAGLTIKVHSVK